jgi:hypothetical protein
MMERRKERLSDLRARNEREIKHMGEKERRRRAESHKTSKLTSIE